MKNKTINGNVFKLQYVTTKKADAKDIADTYRRMGFKARRIKVGSDYNVWVSVEYW